MRRFASGIMLALLLIGMTTLAFNIQPVRAQPGTIIVPDDYPTIQEAINVARPDDTVFVLSGTYHENVVIKKPISLIGENPETTEINGDDTGSAIHIYADDTSVTGFTLKTMCAPVFQCVFLDRCSNNIITGNVVLGGFNGVYLGYSRNNIVSNNEFSDMWDYGVLLYHCHDNVISGNIVMNTWYGIGLWEFSNNNVISGNTTSFGNFTDITMLSGDSITITFTWNTASFAKGNYTIWARAAPLPSETNTTDNILTDGMITVVHPGDLNNDRVVDISDVVLVTAIYRSKCGDPEYRPNSDIIEDCVIDIADVVAVTSHYRETDP